MLDNTRLHRSRACGGDRRLTGLLLEDLPELERLVGGSSGEHLAVRAEAAVQNAGLVSRDLHVLDAGWVAPNAEAVVREAASADDLLVVSAPSKAGDLRVCGDVVDAGASSGVPEVDLAIVGTTASGEEVGLPWAPRHSLDSSTVVGLCELGSCKSAGIPDVDHVVVGSSRKLGTIGAPLETTDLSSMRNELGNLVLSDTNIVVVYEA